MIRSKYAFSREEDEKFPSCTEDQCKVPPRILGHLSSSSEESTEHECIATINGLYTGTCGTTMSSWTVLMSGRPGIICISGARREL